MSLKLKLKRGIMFELLSFGVGAWLGFYWGRYRTLPDVIKNLKDELFSEKEKNKELKAQISTKLND